MHFYKTPSKADPLPEKAGAASSSSGPAWTNAAKLIVVRPTEPLRTAFTSRMVRNRGAGLLEDSPIRASPGLQVRPLAPCFAVGRSPDRDMPPEVGSPCPVHSRSPTFSAVPSSMVPSRASVPIERIRREPLTFTSFFLFVGGRSGLLRLSLRSSLLASASFLYSKPDCCAVSGSGLWRAGPNRNRDGRVASGFGL